MVPEEVSVSSTHARDDYFEGPANGLFDVTAEINAAAAVDEPWPDDDPYVIGEFGLADRDYDDTDGIGYIYQDDSEE